jgi:formylglycine-generating enzyme required for sulfatase activity
MDFDILELVNDAVNMPLPEEKQFENHPLKTSPLEEKILYLQLLSIVMAVDKEQHDHEKKYLNILINSFELEGDLLENLSEFSSAPDKDTINTFLNTFKAHAILPVFLFDALTMVYRDGKVHDTEMALVNILAKQLQLDETIQVNVTALFDAIQTENWHQAARYLYLNLLEVDSFKHVFSFHRQALTELIQIQQHSIFQVGEAEFNMLPIPAGSFNMGSTNGDKEQPVHKVNIKSFSMMETLVTFALWGERVKDGGCICSPKADFGRGQQPLINISWDNITNDFIPWLNKKTGKTFRLPTEAEWEYACRAGTITKYSTGDEITNKQANFYSESTTLVKNYPANPWGLFDMHGNVEEWVQDGQTDNYNEAYDDGRAVAGDSRYHMLRGGCWEFGSGCGYSAYREFNSATRCRKYYGFRLVLEE